MTQAKRSFGATWSRRVFTVPGFILAGSVFWLSLPLWASTLWLYETTFGRGTKYSRVRTMLFISTFLLLETVGILVSFFLWLIYLGRHRSASYLQAHYTLQWWWAKKNFAATKKIFSLNVDIEQAEQGATGPYFLFVRHSSVADTLLASIALSLPYQMAFRYVLKDQLLWDPCLDIVGQRLPNVFLSRKSENRQQEMAAISALAEGLEGQNSLLIYPEGTRFTPKKLKRILDKDPYQGSPELKAIAHGYKNVLPPKPGGVSALLTTYPELDVVFLEHHGFENGVTFKDFWGGSFVDNTISIRVRRVAAQDIPRDDLALWLFKEWQQVDEWVTARAEASGGKRA